MEQNNKVSGNWRSLITFPVKKPWLYLLSGLVWSGVGVILFKYAYQWLREMLLGNAIIFLLLGILLAMMIYLWGFSTLARNNIQRIQLINNQRPSIFAFQKWTSYPLVAVMIALGIFLRKYSHMPTPLLASLYTGLGGGLFLSSILYYRKLWKELQPNIE
jgi:hypothetical protein